MASSFITPTQLILYTDSRRVLEYASDTDAPIDIADADTNAILLEICAAATCEVIAGMLVANRYTVDQLTALALEPVLGAGLRKITSWMAWSPLLDRRKLSEEEFAKLAASYPIAEKQLEKYRTGERILPISGTPEAGLPSAQAFGNPWDGYCGIASKVGLWGSAAYGNCGNILNSRCGCD